MGRNVYNLMFGRGLDLPLSIEVAHPEVDLQLLQASDAAQTYHLVQGDPEHLKFIIPMARGYGNLVATLEHHYINKKMTLGAMAIYKLMQPEHSKGYFGRAGLIGIDGDSAEMIYWMEKSFQGRGIMTAATATIRDFGFQNLNLNRIKFEIDPDNHRSKRVASNIGASYQKIIKRRVTGRVSELWEVKK